MLERSYRTGIWQASRQRYCRGGCQISERLEKFNHESRGYEAPRGLAVRRPTALWIETLLWTASQHAWFDRDNSGQLSIAMQRFPTWNRSYEVSGPYIFAVLPALNIVAMSSLHDMLITIVTYVALSKFYGAGTGKNMPLEMNASNLKKKTRVLNQRRMHNSIFIIIS